MLTSFFKFSNLKDIPTEKVIKKYLFRSPLVLKSYKVIKTSFRVVYTLLTFFEGFKVYFSVYISHVS